jgi:hypothetical protein
MRSARYVEGSRSSVAGAATEGGRGKCKVEKQGGVTRIRRRCRRRCRRRARTECVRWSIVQLGIPPPRHPLATRSHRRPLLLRPRKRLPILHLRLTRPPPRRILIPLVPAPEAHETIIGSPRVNSSRLGIIASA